VSDAVIVGEMCFVQGVTTTVSQTICGVGEIWGLYSDFTESS